MTESSQKTLPEKGDFFPKTVRLILLGLLFAAAFAVRIYHISDPPLNYAPNPQYRSALISKSQFYLSDQTQPEWKRELARIELQSQALYEPPIIENLASLTYRIIGKEALWIPRLYSVFFWLITAVFIYIIVRRMWSSDAALISVSYFLFILFGIFASRSFQPDPLMILAMIVGLYFILNYYHNPSTKTLLLVTLFSAAAIFIKFIPIFPLMCAFGFMGLSSQGWRRFFSNKHNYIFVFGSLLPSVVYYSYVVIVLKSLPSDGTFVFNLLLKPVFWKGWLALLETVIGLPWLLAGFLGIFLIKDRLHRSMIIGLWMSYFLFAIIFTYPTYTHSYYQLFLIPIIAISIAPLAQIVFEALKKSLRIKMIGIAAVFLILILPILLSVRAAKWRMNNPAFIRKAEIAREIGDIVNHSNNTFYLAEHYGSWLRYHGEFRGWNWPTSWDYNRSRIEGRPILGMEENFYSIYNQNDNDYFIVTFLEEFERQPELKTFLFDRFPVLIKNKNYLIFDLRKR
ncbi:ArnT family glycosyltransferase [Acidobacteriota bacterium]